MSDQDPHTITFESLNLSTHILEALEKKGYKTPSEIQTKAIPSFLNDTHHILAQAATGTGKTAAFGLPIIQNLNARKSHIQALILTPTRELAIQIADELSSFSEHKKAEIVAIYGGQPISTQLKKLKKKTSIVVGTPGRVLDHLTNHKLNLQEIDTLIIDEADELLHFGFLDDLDAILDQTNPDKRVGLFSATIPKSIMGLVKKYMPEYHHIACDLVKNKPLIDHRYLNIKQNEKMQALQWYLDTQTDVYGLIFCQTKMQVKDLTIALNEQGYDIDALHGDLTQFQREQVLEKLRKRFCKLLVVTDVAARGIDIKDLSHVINFDFPQNTESYTHRVGRTGRAGKTGKAISFITPREQWLFKQTQKKIDLKYVDIPSKQDIEDQKKEQLIAKIKLEMNQKKPSYIIQLADELAKEFGEKELILALLKGAQPKKEIDHSQYRFLKAEQNQNATEIIVKKGKRDGINANEINQWLFDEVGIKKSDIVRIKVVESHTFVQLSEKDAERVLKHFRTVEFKGQALVQASHQDKKRSFNGSRSGLKRSDDRDRKSSFKRHKSKQSYKYKR